MIRRGASLLIVLALLLIAAPVRASYTAPNLKCEWLKKKRLATYGNYSTFKITLRYANFRDHALHVAGAWRLYSGDLYAPAGGASFWLTRRWSPRVRGHSARVFTRRVDSWPKNAKLYHRLLRCRPLSEEADA